MANLLQMTPFLYVDDVAAAVRFFTARLGFTACVEREEYACVEREVVYGQPIAPGETQ